jgi:hypothetical protein
VVAAVIAAPGKLGQGFTPSVLANGLSDHRGLAALIMGVPLDTAADFALIDMAVLGTWMLVEIAHRLARAAPIASLRAHGH